MNNSVSVILPVYNSEKYLEQAIESCLAQTFQDFELIIIDDGSIDNSLSIIEEFREKHRKRIKVIVLKKNQGVAAARNKGVEMASGKYIVFADADDTQSSNRLEQVWESFESNKVDMVFNNCLMIDEKGRSLNRDQGFPEDLNNNNALLIELKRNYFWTSLAAVKQDSMIHFDTSLRKSSDYDLFLKLLVNDWKFKFIKEPLVKYRIHESNISSNYKKAKMARKRIINKYDTNELKDKLEEQGHSEWDLNITIGMVSEIKEDFQEAVNYFKKAVQLSDNENKQLKANFYLGVVYYKSNRMDESYHSFTKCYQLNKNYPALLNNLGVLNYQVENDFNYSMKLFKAALEKKPGYMDVQHNINRLKNREIPDKVTENFLRKKLVHSTYIKD